MAALSNQATSHVKHQELWSQALSRIAPADKDHLQSLATENYIAALSDFLSLTESSHQESLRKRWKYVRSNGEVVIIRDLFAKVTKWLDIFKQVGDQAVQYDPGHAALPWAGIRFVLQMAVNDINKYGRLVEIISEISFIITRCTILEQQFNFAQSISGSGNVEKQVSHSVFTAGRSSCLSLACQAPSIHSPTCFSYSFFVTSASLYVRPSICRLHSLLTVLVPRSIHS